MRKLLTITGVTVAIILAFGTGVYAASNWMNFEGQDSADKTKENIDKLVSLVNDSEAEYESIIEYYEKVITDLQTQFEEQLKIVTESKDKEILELQKEIQKLLEEITKYEQDADYINHLEAELQKANNVLEQLEEYSNKAVENVKE